MDAQNAVEPTTARPAAPDRRPLDVKKAPLDLPSSPPIKIPPGPSQQNDDDGNSDTETVILPGKDGFSPSKTRKLVNKSEPRRQESSLGPVGNSGSNGDHRPLQKERDRERGRERDRARDAEKIPRSRSGKGGVTAEAASSLVAKKKKALQDRNGASLKDGSSGLSSAPASPPSQAHIRRITERRSHGDSDSESTRHGSPKPIFKARDRSREKARVSDKLVPHKRKASTKPDSDDEGEPKKARRPRLSSHVDPISSTPGKHHARDHKPSLNRQQHSDTKAHTSKHAHGQPQNSRHRSTSPVRHPPLHRRSLSTQLPSTNGPVLKKRRIPPPLSTDHLSDDSSGSGSLHPIIRVAATPATADWAISPAKMLPHKKHLDAHGQTLLARACAKGEYDIAKARLMERPDDLNVADYAGNTPLQIASLQGHSQIVKLLVDSGCALDCMNNDRDTPLLDAVDNGHLEVVRILLDAGVNPRKTNIHGEEPIARVTDDMENAEKIRAALQEARNRPNAAWRRASEEHHLHDHSPQETHPPDRHFRDARSHGPESPRQSLAALSHAALGRRAATSRATKTSNSQLYKPLDDKTLRDAALRGDEETVLRILQVKEGFNDPESMVGAARGGHEMIMQLLLALGACDPDPDPVPSLPKDANTPMLAAIGQGTLGVVKLLLDQSSFDPTRKFGGLTYYEIARERAGPDWQLEEDMLKKAYDSSKKGSRDSLKDKSPNRRAQSKEQRAARAEMKAETVRAHKRKVSSPTRELARAKSLSSKSSSLTDKRRAHSFSESDDQASKRGPGRPRKEVPSITVNTRDDSPRVLSKPKVPKQKRQDTDHGANSSDGEMAATKPRRKLVSGRELKDERERQRRSSMVSNHSAKEAPSPRDKDDGLDKIKTEPLSEKYHDRAKAIRRDDSKDRMPVSGEGSAKRHRSSVTPPRHPGGSEKEDGEAPVKRRRLDVEGKEKRQRSTNSSPEDRHRKPSTLRESTSSTKSAARDLEKAARREVLKAAKAASKPVAPADKISDSKSTDAEGTDAPIKLEHDSDSQHKKDLEKKKRAKMEAAEARKRREEEEQARQEEERKRREEEDKRRREDEEKRHREAEAHQQEEARKEAARRQLEEEEERKRKEMEERKRREAKEAEERLFREEQERLRLAEEERKRKEEEEAKRRQEEEDRLKREEEQRKREEEKRKREEEEKRKREEEEKRKREEEEQRRREEEERQEQLLREAAEAQRREAEEKERRLREEQERLRLAREAEQRRIEAEERRIREEQERLRIASLPPLLRWFDACSCPRSRDVASKFATMQGVRYETITPNHPEAASGEDARRELWVLNSHVAFLLGDKDLSLSKYPSWRRVEASHIAKTELMGVEGGTYALTSPSVRDLARELPGYQETLNGSRGLKMAKDRGDAHKLFVAMDLFFVRVSDFMSVAKTMPHLRDLEIAVQYRELPLSEEMRSRRQLPLLWKNDAHWATRNHGSAPGALLYVNGMCVGETKTGRLVKTSKTPFPDGPVPRRGFTSVPRNDPDFERLCREQGLEHLIGTQRLPNGISQNASSPTSSCQLHALTPVTPGAAEPTEADVLAPLHLSGNSVSESVAGAVRLALPNGLPESGN